MQSFLGATSAPPSSFRSIARALARRSAISTPQIAVCFALATACSTSPAEMPRADAGASSDTGGHILIDAGARPDAFSPPDAFAAHDAFVAHDGGPTVCGCFDGPGTYCEADVAAQAGAEHCTAIGASRTGHRLLTCGAHGWTATATCGSGCESGESGASAECSLPVCDCFVSVSWCGASAARHGLTLSPPCRVPLVPDHDSDILGCNAAGDWIVLTACAHGCQENPTGTPDSCVGAHTPTDPGWAACAHHGAIASGMDPEASDRIRCAGVTAAMITQTVGFASASAGYHAPDGNVDGHPYTAAVDLSVRGLSTSEISALLHRLGQNGFAAWYRQPGHDGWPSSEVAHIHAVFAGVIMKSQLREQIRDYLAGRNGLASHTVYSFWHAPTGDRDVVRLLFERHYAP
jgi:hypothetical protein